MILRDALLLTLSSFLMGSSYVVTKFILKYASPLMLTGVRFMIVAAIMCPFFFKWKLPWKKIVASAFIMAFGFQALIVTAVKNLDVATTIICQQMSVPFTCLLGSLLFKDTLGIRRLIGLIIAFIGMIIVVGGPNVNQVNMAFVLLAISAAFFYALNNIILKQVHYVNPNTTIAVGSLISFPFLILMSLVIEDTSLQDLPNFSFSVWLGILYMAIPTTIIAFGIWTQMLHTYSVHQIAPFSLLAPIFGVICSIIFLGEKLNWNIAIGGLITILGIAIINVKGIKINKLFNKLRNLIKPNA
ncbi:MAG: EamA family transporter [Sphingobacteriia bacterium]|nr:EamA family transporter [Sphingobacteriia bacterium]